MHDPIRLKDAASGRLMLSVLDSAREDAPSTASRKALEVALGVGIVGAGATTTAAAAASAASTASAASSTAGGAGAGAAGGVGLTAVAIKTPVTLSLTKLIVPALFAIAGTATYAVQTRPMPAQGVSPTAHRVERMLEPPAANPMEDVQPAAVKAPRPMPSEGERERPRVAVAPIALSSVRSTVPTSVPESVAPPPSLAGELAGVARARQASAAGNHMVALAESEEYDRTYPRGTFAHEMLIVRVDALVSLGRIGEAKKGARQYLAHYPKGPASTRFSHLIDSNP